MAAAPPEGIAKVQSVWERHPIPDVTEQPVHFVRKRTDLIKDVSAIGLEDSQEWHRVSFDKFMHGEPWDRAILVNCVQHYEDLKNEFPSMKHYWEEADATFGEQIVLDGHNFNADFLCLGDVLESSSGLQLCITAPRLCCFRVDHRYPAIPEVARSGAPGTVRRYASASSRGGFFCKVLVPSTVREGDTFRVKESPHPSYPLSYLSSLVYGETPTSVKFSGTDAQLSYLCSVEELCSFEWKDRLIDYRANLMRDHPVAVPETMGTPISHEEGMKLIAGEWCMSGSAGNHLVHERAAMDCTDHIEQQVGNSIMLRLDGDEIHSDKECLEGRHIYAKPVNNRGNFALEMDFGGFPAFPRYAYMTHIGKVKPEVFLLFSSGGKWRKIPDDI